MKINKKLSHSAETIGLILNSHKLNEEEQFDVLSQLLIKTFLLNFKNNKEGFMEILSYLYDTLEENWNVMGYVGRD